MKKSEIYKKSLSLLKQFVEDTPKDELDKLISNYKNLGIEGPTFSEYLDGIQVAYENISLGESNSLTTIDLSQCDIYHFADDNYYYVPPPPVTKKYTKNKKDLSVFEGSFFLL